MWTWSMVDSTHNRPGLGSFLLELGAKERARLRAECMGNASLRATLAVSKWRKKSNKSEGSTSGAISTAELPMLSEEGEETEEEEEEEVEVAAAEKPELSALQKKVRRAYRKNSFMNMMSTASTLSLMGKQEKYAVAEPAGEHTGGPSHVGTQKECADNAAACSTAQDGAAQPMAASGAPEGTRMAAKEEEEETPTLSVARVAANGGAPSSQPSSPVWASLVFAPENSEERAPPSRSDSGSVLLDLNSSSCKLAPPPTPSQKQRLHKRQPEAKAEMVPGEVPLESGDLHISDDGDCYEVSETITTVTTSTTRTTRTKHRPRDTRATPSPGPVAESTQRQAETELGLGAHLLGGSPGAPGNASVDSRASAGAAQSGRAGAVRGSVFTGIRGSVTSMIHALGGVSVKRLRSLKTKKKAPTARVLFASMHINVFRLQQCVPLDYLEEQAQLEVADDERRRRHQERSAQAKHEVTAEMRLAGDRMLEKVSKDYGGNQVKGNRSAQPVMESVDPTILAKSLTRRFDAVPSYKDVMKQLEDEEQAKRLKIQTRWDKLRKRNMELPVERMLGTALVQAFLGIKAIISKADLAEQAEKKKLLFGDMTYEEKCRKLQQGAGRFWVILIIVGILTPTTMTLSQMFIMAQNVTKKAERCFGAVPMAVMQTVFVTLYALFFNFQKFNKALAVTFVAIIGLLLKPRHIRRAIAFVVQSYKISMRYVSAPSHGSHAQRCQAITAVAMATLTVLVCRKEKEEMSVAAALVVQMVTGAKQRVEKTEYEELLEKVHLVSPVEEHLQQLAYFIILVSWFTCAWVLFTFSMLIREMMGDEAEAELVASWATVLAVEMFGKEAIKLICIRLFVESMMNKAEQLFTGQDHPAHRWFEQYILLKLTQDSRVTTDDTGDQDMGDDADADGGGDDEIDAGDDDIGGGIDM
eukprot:gene16764-19915_t